MLVNQPGVFLLLSILYSWNLLSTRGETRGREGEGGRGREREGEGGGREGGRDREREVEEGGRERKS